MRVALYERVSTQEQAIHGLSLGVQDDLMREWCAENDHVIVDVYRDEGISGRKPIRRRPELARLLEDIKAGKVDLVLFQKLDRWTRNIRQYYIAQEILDAHGVAWKALLEDYETITASGRFKVNIMLAVAENEADRASERVKAVLDHKRANGEMASGRVPTGYKRKDNIISFDPETHDAVVAFFDEYLRSFSLTKARDAALEHGVSLSYKMAYALMKSPVCVGAYGAPTYITEAQQSQILNSLRRFTRTEKHESYMFNGLIWCADCGLKMYGKSTDKGKYGIFIYYFCRSHRMKGSSCINHININENDIEQHLLYALEEKVADAKSKAESAKQVDNSAKIAALQKKRGKLKDLYMNDLISLEEYKSDLKAYDQEIESLSATEQNTNLDAIEELIQGDWQSLYNDLTREEKKAFWGKIIKRIEIDHNRSIDFTLL